MINVCFGLHDKTGRYSKFTGTAILSLFENTSSNVTVHILHDNTLTQDNREKFIYLAGRYGQAVKFYNVEELCAEKLTEYVNLAPAVKNSIVTVGAFYRLLTPKLFPPTVDKIIYLDADIIVNLDVKELWQIELGDKVLAAVPEKSNGMDSQNFPLCQEGYVKAENYFNSGVLMMNLNLLRGEEEALRRGVKFRGERTRGNWDQDILNYLFSTNYLKLPVEFNYFIKSHRNSEKFLSKKIYHYTDSVTGVGLTLDMHDPFNRLWMDYFIKSPWFDTEAIGRLYEKFLKKRADLMAVIENSWDVKNKKTRAFMTIEEKLETLVENFSVKPDEEVIIVKEGTPIQNILDEINSSRNEKIFFMMLPRFPFKILTEAGFVAGKDFCDAYDFLPSATNPLNSYPFVAAM